MPLAPWPARVFVVALVTAIAVCGAFSIEAWPLTGWRLFSRERQQLAGGWLATSVDARGSETPIDFDRFPKANRYFVSVMSKFATLSSSEQEATCQAWARLERRYGGRNTRGGLRLYATVRDLRRHIGHRAPVTPIATLRWTCAGGHGARAAVPGRSAPHPIAARSTGA